MVSLIDAPSKDLLNGVPWMETYTGIQFTPSDPKVSQIDIKDIGHALSMVCRYNGHCQEFYSVAEHSYHMARHAYLDTLGTDAVEEIALVALLHDAAEAYISDLPRAAKDAVAASYKPVEARIEDVIWEKFGLVQAALKHASYVKSLDTRIIVDEHEQNMGASGHEWAHSRKNGIEPLGVRLRCYDPTTASSQFLSMYWFLELERSVRNG